MSNLPMRQFNVARFLPSLGARPHPAFLIAVVSVAIVAAGGPANAGTEAVRVTAGESHSCALTSGGGVKCWGGNAAGQLGDSTRTTRTNPVYVSGLTSGAIAVAAGARHTCAVTSAGGVKCWGDNTSGQLGDATTMSQAIPVDVIGLQSGVVAVAAGARHTCALTAEGGVKCWGSNTSGQVGGNVWEPFAYVPVDVTGLTNGVIAVSAGQAHTCAVTIGGGVKCWGSNQFGQVGDGGATTSRMTPVDVIGLPGGMTAVAAGGHHTCAVTSGGGVKCWGDNTSGQLGDGTMATRLSPVDVSGTASGVTALVAGSAYTCALTVDGSTKCWGADAVGQLGDGTMTYYRATPVNVSGLTSGVVALAAGVDHTCAATTDGGVKCWGDMYDGPHTDGRYRARIVPTDVRGLTSGAIAVATAESHACAVTAGGGVKCWGGAVSTPADVSGLSSGVAAIAVGGHDCALTTGGDVRCWTGWGTIPADVTGLTNGVRAVVAGMGHNCALTSGGGVKCWGSNYSGQLGDGTTTSRTTAVYVNGLSSGVTAVSAGTAHTCAATSVAVKCWGWNEYGQVGYGPPATTNPTDVGWLPAGVVALAAGQYHSCALTSAGGMKCWGDNSYGQFGNGSWNYGSYVAVDAGLTTGVTAIAAGMAHTCALTTGGAVKCWGDNNYGQLGDGTLERRYAPVDVIGLSSGVVAVAAAGNNTCALTSGGGVKCWGANYADQIGDGMTTAAPVSVIGFGTSIIALGGDLAFGHVPVGASAMRTLTISNTGNALLTVTTIDCPAGFVASWTGTIPPGGSQAVAVTFAPTTITSYGGTVTVNADQTRGTNTVVVSGSGYRAMDFNADGTADLAWRNRVTGDIRFWLMNGGGTTSEVTISGPQDRRWRIVAIADVNADGSPDLVMRHATSGENQVWLMNGTTHESTAALPTVADARWQMVAAVDFNGDGHADLLWRNSANGDVVVWYLNGATYAGFAWVASIADPVWMMAGVADFNGDSKPDIVWRNIADGRNLVWYMNGAAYADYAWLPSETDTAWAIVGVADYDGDGHADLLWRNGAAGENRLWRMRDATLVATDALAAIADPDWEGIGAEAGRARLALADFNADGHPDIVWHNQTTGENTIWYMGGANGATKIAEGTVEQAPGLERRPVAVSDFNGDGLPDIVWRSGNTGENKIWLMTGRTKTGEMSLPTIEDANWHIVGVGDFNQDGDPDLAWRNYVTGVNIIWFLRNGQYAGYAQPPTIADANWKIVAVGDFNGDGWPDLFWRNETTGVNIAWFLVNGEYAGWGQPPTISDPTWTIVGANDFNGDGKADVLWRNATDGRNLIWYLKDGSYLDFAWVPTLSIEWTTGVGQ